jgi:hypothetical protein
MGFLDRILGRPPTFPLGTLADGTHHPVAKELLKEIKRRLERAPIHPAVRLQRLSRGLMAHQGGIVLRIDFLEVDEQQLHAHIVTSIANHKSPRDLQQLDACIVGRGARAEAIGQAAEIWVVGVAAPLFSLITGREQLGARHFTGAEPWGVPGRHGWIGQTISRGTRPFDEEVEESLGLFAYDGYPEDKQLHLVKVTLQGLKGKWKRYLEIDGHAGMHVDEDWECGVPAPEAGFILNLFALFFWES